MKAEAFENLLNLAAHPLGWPLVLLLRRMGPVVRVPGFGVVINDAELAGELLRRDEEFTKNGPRSISRIVTLVLGPSALLNMDGEGHARLRAQVSQLLAPSELPALLASGAPLLAGLASDLAMGQTVDLVAFMRRLSGRLTFDMLGIEPASGTEDNAYEGIMRLGTRMSTALGFSMPSAAKLRALRADSERLGDLVREGYERQCPPVHSLAHRLRSLGLSFEEARSLLLVFFLTGTLTTAAALPRLAALLLDSGQLERLRGDPAAVARAVHEGLRFTAPVPATARIVQRDATVRGRRFRAGSRLVILTCNLARDPRLFRQPNTFDIDRDVNARSRHLWFGAGPHFCLGYALAQLELQSVLSELSALPGRLQVVRRRAARRGLLAAYARLDVRLEPGSESPWRSAS